MTELITVPKANEWTRLKALVLDSVSSPITRRVYNLGLDEFFAWYAQEPRAGFTKATVAAWRVALEARGLGAVSINVRITAVRKLAVEAADNGLLAPELANGITRVKGGPSTGVRLGNWLSARQAQTLLNAPDATKPKGLRDRAILLLYMNTRSMTKTLIVALAVPFSAIGAVWFLYALGYNMSVAVWVGIIALLGVDAETGVFMLLYLYLAYEEARRDGRLGTMRELRQAIIAGAVKRIRPKVMTTATMFVGLIPIMWATGSGSDVMKRICCSDDRRYRHLIYLGAIVYPVIYQFWRSRSPRWRARAQQQSEIAAVEAG